MKDIDKLIKRARQLNIQVNDFLSESNMKDGYVYGMIHQYGVENNAESIIQFCTDNNIHNMYELLNFVGGNIFKT